MSSIPGKFLIANWKSNLTFKEALAFVDEFIPQLPSIGNKKGRVVIALPYPYILPLGEKLKDAGIELAGQNVSPYPVGSYTGEIAASQLASLGAKWVIIGHFERRHYFHEERSMIALKLKEALSNKIKVILCVGEKKEDRERGETLFFLQQDLKAILGELPPLVWQDNLFISYEPVWAIGTGQSAFLKEIEEVAFDVKKILESMGGSAPFLYGGSVSEKNLSELIKSPLIDGVLVGNASLKCASFVKMVSIFAEALS